MNESLENEIKEELSNWNELKDKVLNVIPAKDISFRTRNVLSSILDRLELSNDDRKDLEKYIIYGGGENIEYIKSFLQYLIAKVPNIQNILNKEDSIKKFFDIEVDDNITLSKLVKESTDEGQIDQDLITKIFNDIFNSSTSNDTSYYSYYYGAMGIGDFDEL